MEDSQVFVGIDVSGTHLDVTSRPTGEIWQVANDADGISALTQQLVPLRLPDRPLAPSLHGHRGDQAAWGQALILDPVPLFLGSQE